MSVENLQILLYVLAGIALILFLVAIIMSHKSWKAHTLIMVFLVFLASGTTMVLSVQALKAHQAWREILHGSPGERASGLIAEMEKLQLENQELEFGKEEPDGQITKPGIAQLSLKLAEVLYDRGRMWTDCKPAPMAPDSESVTVTIQQQSPSQITVNLILYVFEARPFSAGGPYLGMFRVSAVTGGAGADAGEDQGGDAAAGQVVVTLVPNWKMSQQEQTRLAESARNEQPWIMYDKMPVDGHQVFAIWMFGNEETTQESEFDQMVQEAAKEKFKSLPEPEAAAKLKEWTAMLKEFSQFDDIDRTARLEQYFRSNTRQEFIEDHQPARDDHPPERIEEQVEFQEDYPDDETEPRFVDNQMVWLLREPPEGTNIIKDPITNSEIQVEAIPTIDELVRLEIVERVDEGAARYSRKLRDYGYLFRDLYLALDHQQLQLVEIGLDIKEVNQLLTDKLQVTKQFESEKDRLTNDRTKFQGEQQIIERLINAVQDQTKTTRSRMAEIREETIRLGKRLNAAQMRAVEAINRRTPDSRSAAGAG